MRYRIEYAPQTKRHFRALTARQRATVVDTIDQQLRDQPTVETKNRKALRPNPLAAWELRVGELRVYYRVQEAESLVYILAVGVKQRHRVSIGNEVVEL